MEVPNTRRTFGASCFLLQPFCLISQWRLMLPISSPRLAVLVWVGVALSAVGLLLLGWRLGALYIDDVRAAV